MFVKLSARGAVVVFLGALCVLSAPLAAQAVTNPAPSFTPNSFNAVEGTPFSGSIVVSALTGTWNWVDGNNFRFSTNVNCPVGSNDVAPAGIVFADYNNWPGGAFTGPIVMSGTPSVGSSTGGSGSNGIYNTCVDIRDDYGNHVYQAVVITVTAASTPVPTPSTPVAEPELTHTGIDSASLQVSAIAGIVLLAAGAAFLNTRRKLQKRN
jgi:hypothetical protein